jgi:hypothetical protein
MFSDSIYQILHLKKLKNHEKFAKKGTFDSKFPDLHVYTIKTPLIGRISIKTVFSWSQKPSYWRSPYTIKDFPKKKTCLKMVLQN